MEIRGKDLPALLAQYAPYTPCEGAMEWAAENRDKTLAQLWGTCPRGDWVLWMAAVVGVDHKLVVRAACGCARLALRYVPDGEDRPRIAIETAEAWVVGNATLAEVRVAATAAYAAKTKTLRKCAIITAKHIGWREIEGKLITEDRCDDS